jgi:branched-chain amino acid transport system ATP-binding protein
MNEVLKVSNLSAGYGPLQVLRDVEFTINPGERVGLVGLNGHGKSTLFRAITGLVGWQNGSILLNGTEIGGRRTHGPGRNTHLIAHQGVALMPQGDAIFLGLTVREHLDAGAFSRRAWRERKPRRERVLDIFPALQQLLKQPVGKLSGGERRMVSLARGLMGDAKLYLVDEPSLGLAPKVSRSVINALGKVTLTNGAMIVAEQNLQILEGFVDRMIGMHAGELKGDMGTTSAGTMEF